MNTYAKLDPSKSCGNCGQGSKCNCDGGCGACGSGDYVSPRFFSGQLLTEDDLQVLANYVSAKNRLHNRHFFGAGVVCGLEVICNPCGGGKITIEPGYALDCCGNDIVLNCAKELDINAMIRDLKLRQLGGYDCGDPCADVDADCSKSEKKLKTGVSISRHYCLYIRYCEEKTDPVAPYAIGESCIAPSCEPTRIREGVNFELRCREKEAPPNDFFIHFLACIGDLIDTESVLAGDDTRQKTIDLREWLLNRLDKNPRMSDCDLRKMVAGVIIPDEQATIDLELALCLLKEALLRFLRNCLCLALNPPCPPCDDSAVLLACLEVKDCEVLSICNLERTFVLTPVTWRYWNPLLRVFGEFVENQLCCKPINLDCGLSPSPIPKSSTSSEPIGEKMKLNVKREEVFSQTLPITLLTNLYPALHREDAKRLLNIATSLWTLIPEGDSDLSKVKSQAGVFLDKATAMLGDRPEDEKAALQQENIELKSKLSTMEASLVKLEARLSTIERKRV